MQPKVWSKAKRSPVEPQFYRASFGWAGWIRTSGMTESKSVALPLGDSPLYKNGKQKFAVFHGVGDGTRTHDNQNHNLALYQLNYTHHIGAPKGTRTPGPLLRRQLLYPPELWAHMSLSEHCLTILHKNIAFVNNLSQKRCKIPGLGRP